MSTSPLVSGEGNPFDDGSQSLIFGKYEVIRRLALGGMGEVFLARQTGVAVDRLVILKSLLPELAEQEGFVDQFLDEARVAATLNHPNIVGIYEVGLWNGVYFIAMEFIHGGDLSKLQRTAAKKGFGIPFQVSARMVHDAALGLDHAHHAKAMDGTELNIVHRDISPQNIMVRGDGVTKVVDFGIAKASNRSTRTATGMLKGKLQYMAPEQVKGDEITGRADQFALGVVLWELSTNRRLFKGENELKTLEKLLKDEVPNPSSIVSGFPPALEAVIMRMLSRDPSKRYARLRDAALDLRSYLDSCSRAVGETEVAEFVRSILGEQLKAVTQDLTPSQENFIISLDKSRHEPGATPTTMTQAIEIRRKRSVGLAAGLVGAVAVMGVAAFVLLGDDPVQDDLAFRSPAKEARNKEDQAIIEKSKMRSAFGKAHKYARAKDGTTNLEISEPKGASVIIDGKMWKEKVPTIVTGLVAGSHEIVLEQNGAKLALKKQIEVERARYIVKSKPSGATVKFRHPDGYSGEVKGGDDIGKILGPGKHEVTFERSGYVDKRVTLEIKPGKNKPKVVSLDRRKIAKRATKPRNSGASTSPRPRKETKPEPPVVKEDGYLTVRTEPWAKISIDGSPKGSTPLFKVQLKAGRHKVRLVNEAAGINVTKSVTISPGKNKKIVWKLE